MKGNFDRAFDEVIKYEGGYVNHPKDPGGPTNLGITQATLSKWLGRKATVADVKALTKAKVKPIYKKYYWDAVKGDQLPGGVDLAMFDFAVNSGVGRAIRYLQSVVGVPQDGQLGPVTMAAVNRYSAQDIVRKLVAKRRGFLMGLNTWKTFGTGWNRRLASVQKESLAMAPPQTGVAFAGLSDEPAPDYPVEDIVQVSAKTRGENQAMADYELQGERGTVPMQGTKPLIASKVFWANALGFLSVLPIVGNYLTGVDVSQAADALSGAIAGIAFIASTIARIYSKYQIAS